MPSFASTIASYAKAHHESVNQAYTAFYFPGSASATPETSRSNSVAMASPTEKKAPTNASKAWKAIKKHHSDMSQAYQVYYSPAASRAGSRSNSASTTPRVSSEEPRHAVEVEEEQKPRNYQKVFKAIKNKAVEHHKSVNAASKAYYGY